MAKDLNPRNQDSTLFKKLTRVFSGPIASRKVQNYHRLRRSYQDKFGSKFKSVSGQSFKKSVYNPYTLLQSERISNYNRGERYREFDQMEYTPIIHSALDIYADEMTTSSPINPVLKIECPNEELKIILENLYYNILNVEFNLFPWVRSYCKYGDFVGYIDVDQEKGVTGIMGIKPEEIERLEGVDETNPNYVQYQWNARSITLESWQVLHLRNIADDKYAPYGVSVLDSIRRSWRQYTLLVDAMLAYRVVRSPERRIFYIDVGDIQAQDVPAFMEQAITQMKRHQIVDADTGRVDLRMNPLNVDEDYFIPVRTGTETRIETLPGAQHISDIDDVMLIRDEMLSGLKIPQSYLARDEASNEDKETLAHKDVRFSNTIQRMQRPVVRELERVGRIHLVALGYDKEDLLSFKVKLNNPSKIAEFQELESWRTKMEVASMANEGPFSYRWITENVFGLSQEEAMRMKREKYHDVKYEAIINAIREGGDEMAMDVGGLEGGGDFEEGDLMGLGDEMDLDADIGDAEEGSEFDNEEDTGNDLLISPEGAGKRDEYTTPGAKGKKYKRVASDKRDMGARKRSYASKYSRETGVNTARNTFPGMNSISRGIYESGVDSVIDGMFEKKQDEEPVSKGEKQMQLLEEQVDIFLKETENLKIDNKKRAKIFKTMAESNKRTNIFNIEVEDEEG